MLGRKILAAYFASWTIVLWVSFPFASVGGATWHAARDYASWALGIAFYAVPSLFLYGILVSLILEWAAAKLHAAGPGEWIVSGLFHVLFGVLFGVILQSSLFSMMGGTAAIVFFGLDRMIRLFLPRIKPKIRVFMMAAPLLLFGTIVGTLYVSSPPKPPFTAMDAVTFATSGSGTTIDWFPKQAGTTKLQIEGYDVERETKVEETAAKEKYLVYFIERWRKGEVAGEHRMIYEVARGTMGAKGTEGAEPPYPRKAAVSLGLRS